MPENTQTFVSTPQNPLYHAPLVAVLSLLCGTMFGVLNPLAGIVLPPCIGPIALVTIEIVVKAHKEGKEAWMTWISTATVFVPIGALSYLMV